MIAIFEHSKQSLRTLFSESITTFEGKLIKIDQEKPKTFLYKIEFMCQLQRKISQMSF